VEDGEPLSRMFSVVCAKNVPMGIKRRPFPSLCIMNKGERRVQYAADIISSSKVMSLSSAELEGNSVFEADSTTIAGRDPARLTEVVGRQATTR